MSTSFGPKVMPPHCPPQPFPALQPQGDSNALGGIFSVAMAVLFNSTPAACATTTETASKEYSASKDCFPPMHGPIDVHFHVPEHKNPDNYVVVDGVECHTDMPQPKQFKCVIL